MGLPWAAEGNWLWKMEDALASGKQPGSLSLCQHEGFRLLISMCWAPQEQRASAHSVLQVLSQASLFETCKRVNSVESFEGESSMPLLPVLEFKQEKDAFCSELPPDLLTV